jgi:hypothetical protein
MAKSDAVILTIIISAILLCFILPLSLSELIIANTYANPLTCQPHGELSSITFKTWLNVEGILAISYSGLLVFTIISGLLSEGLMICMGLLTVIYGLLYGFFNIAWLIIGAVGFWGHCNSNTGDYSVNCMMWTALIIGFVTLYDLLTKTRSSDK